MRVGALVAASPLLLRLSRRWFCYGLFFHFRLQTEHSLHVLNGIFFHNHVHSALHVPGKTLRFQRISDGAKEKGNAQKYIKYLIPESAHFAESQGGFLFYRFAESGIIEVNFLCQV